MGFFDPLLLLNYPGESSRQHFGVVDKQKSVNLIEKRENVWRSRKYWTYEILLNLLVCEKYWSSLTNMKILLSLSTNEKNKLNINKWEMLKNDKWENSKLIYRHMRKYWSHPQTRKYRTYRQTRKF